MNKDKRGKTSAMRKIWRRKAKRKPSISNDVQKPQMTEITASDITDKQTHNLLMKSSHMIEASSENIEATMKIDEIPHNSRQSTNRMTQEQEFLHSQKDGQQRNPTLMLKKDEITREYQEWCTMQKGFKSIKTWNTLQPGNEMEWLKITKDFLSWFPKVNSKQKLQIIV